MSYERSGGKLHGNISRSDYGNAIIGRYGRCFEEGVRWVYGTGESCAAEERLAMVEGESAYNPWTHISHKELIYLLQKSISYRNKVLRTCS